MSDDERGGVVAAALAVLNRHESFPIDDDLVGYAPIDEVRAALNDVAATTGPSLIDLKPFIAQTDRMVTEMVAAAEPVTYEVVTPGARRAALARCVSMHNHGAGLTGPCDDCLAYYGLPRGETMDGCNCGGRALRAEAVYDGHTSWCDNTSTASLPKPPLGLTPRRIAQDGRLAEIDGAIRRYLDAGFTIPQEWLEEREELLA